MDPSSVESAPENITVAPAVGELGLKVNAAIGAEFDVNVAVTDRRLVHRDLACGIGA